MTTGIPLNQEYTRRSLGMFVHWNMSTFDGTEQANPNSSLSLITAILDVDNVIAAAKVLGAQYIVWTVKHSDGTPWWNSATTAHNFTNAPPYAAWFAAHGGVDLVAYAVNKCNAAGIKPCFYFSIGDATFQQSQGKSTTALITYSSGQLANLLADYNQSQYLAYIQTQLTELLTNYGQIAGLWLDAGYWAMANTYYPWASAAAMLSFIHGLQPNIQVGNNSHTHLSTDSDVIEWEGGGAGNPPGANNGPQEFCDTLQANNNWFWHSTVALNTTASIVANFQKCNQNNCAYLLDVPPDNTGVIPSNMTTALTQIGAAL